MTPDEHDRIYMEGSNAAWRRILGEAIRELGQETRDVHGWRCERADAVACLRTVCEAFGDNDWPDDLHLADVIQKHLARHLHESEPTP